MFYTGTSMNPTLKTGDRLNLVPYGDDPIETGDVVVFRHWKEKYHIVHRVIAIDSRGLRTRGDNNASVDPWILKPEEVLGRIISAGRDAKILKIHGGGWGRMRAQRLRMIKKAKTGVLGLIHEPYVFLSRSGIFRRLSPLLPKIRVLTFSRPQGNELQLFMGSFMIGRYWPAKAQWRIMRPYRLIMDETVLSAFIRKYDRT
jgi:signal peptidase